jgi:hypothetical protein
MDTLPHNKFIKEHDKSFPKRDIDLQFEELVSNANMSTLEVISTTARLITRIEPMEPRDFEALVDGYIDLRIERGEFSKALYYSYIALVDCFKDPENIAKQEKKNKILNYIVLCAQKMKEESEK